MLRLNASGYALVCAALLAASSARAGDCPAFSDFEAGLPAEWTTSTTFGSGGTGTETHNGSKMAYVSHAGGGQHGLSCDVTFSPARHLSFDMQATAISFLASAPSYAGVQLSFLNSLNVPLATLGLFNVANYTLGTQESTVLQYKKPVSGQFRTMQFVFRLGF